MAVSSTSSSSGSSIASIDVASVVEQLMAVENKPLEALTTKIDQQKLVISELGIIKNKLAVFQDALDDFENPNSYNSVSVSTTDSKILTATGSNGALLGNYSVTNVTVAKPDSYSISGFTATTNGVTLASEGFSITVAGVTYNTSGTPSGTSVLGASPTVANLVSWINSLGVNVAASVVKTTSSTSYALQIYGTETGTSNAVTYTGLTSGTDGAITLTLTTARPNTASDSSITVNGTVFTRSSNAINDIIDGITFNLIKTSTDSQTINVSRGIDSSETVIKKMIESYNDLISTYKTMTANSNNSDKPGTFANNPTMLSFINEIKAKFSAGATYGSSMSSKISLGAMGIDLLRDGTLEFNPLSFADAQSDDLQGVLSEGVTVGYASSTNDLTQYIDDLIGITGSGGTLADVISTQNIQVLDLYKRQVTLQDKLAKVQDNLINQYSALNSLLYQLSSTSNSLTSALDALSNNNKN